MTPTPSETLYWGLKLSELVSLIGIIIGPIVAVCITLIIEARRRKRDQQVQTMRMLVSTRHLPSDPAYTTAINMIPVDFNKNRRVMAAWKAYIDAVFHKPTSENIAKHKIDTEAKQTKLIFAIMRYLGYELAEIDIQTTPYAAGGMIDRDNLMLRGWEAWPRIADALEAQTNIYTNAQSAGTESTNP
jgi:hypothetical protein